MPRDGETKPCPGGGPQHDVVYQQKNDWWWCTEGFHGTFDDPLEEQEFQRIEDTQVTMEEISQ